MRRLLLALLLVLMAAPSWGQASRNHTNTSGQCIQCGDIDALEGIDNLTVGCWARNNTNDANTRHIIGKEGPWSLRKTGVESLTFVITDTGGLRSATGATSYTVGAWFFAVGTYDRSLPSGRVKVYLNGVLDGAGNGTDAALSTSSNAITVGVRTDCSTGGSTHWIDEIAHCFVEARTWSAVEIAESYRSLVGAQRAASGTGGYLPLWDNAADPGAYIGLGLFAGVCSATTDPASSSLGPPVFIPAGGGQ